MKNQKKQQAGTNMPAQLHAAAASRAAAPAPPKKKKAVDRTQRFYRIPFIRPEDKSVAGGQGAASKGQWYAHFDGQWIARQMEIHADREPVLLVAGAGSRDQDLQMCQLSLDDTGLAGKRGAEILGREFEAKWKACGGKPYVHAENNAKKK
jgi:myosin-6